MILIVTTREHAYTHSSVEWQRGLDVEVMSYDRFFRRRYRPYRGTHIFTDFDRLAPWEVQEAALLYRKLKGAGIRVMNDPARALGRFGLLRALNRNGLNGFDAYRVESLERPARWPVFLRMEGDHKAPLSGLLHNEPELDEAIERAVAEGAPRFALVIIEYAAEPIRTGLFRKLSVFKIGETLLGYTCVHDDQWLVKYGKLGIAPTELYDEEYSFVADNGFAAALEPAFRIAGIDYGRADFGLVGGRPQIYEINSNPHVDLHPRASPVDIRNRSNALFTANYIRAMADIDSASRPAWQIGLSVIPRSARTLSDYARRGIAKSRRVLNNSDAISATGPA